MYENNDYNIYDDYAAINRELNLGSARTEPEPSDEDDDRPAPTLPLKLAVPANKKDAPAPKKKPKKEKKVKEKKERKERKSKRKTASSDAPANVPNVPAAAGDPALRAFDTSSATALAGATVALILGIVGLIFCIPPIGTVLGIIGLIFGIKALAGHVAKKGKAIVGLILSVLALLASLGIAYWVYYNDIIYDIEYFFSDYYGIGDYDPYSEDEDDEDYDYYEEDDDYYDNEDYDYGTEADYSYDSRAAIPDDGEEPVEYLVGESLDDDGLDIIYMASGFLDPARAKTPPPSGMKYIFIELGCENYSTDERAIDASRFTCYADGTIVEQYTGESGILKASLPPEGTAVGRVYFSVPEKAQAIAIEYTYKYDTTFNERSVLVFAGEQSAGFTFGENPYDEGDDDYLEDEDYYEDDTDEYEDFDYDYEDDSEWDDDELM